MKMRDLEQEQRSLRALLFTLPWLKVGRTAAVRGLPYSTFTAYMCRATDDISYRHLRNEAHADIMWDVLRQTAGVIAHELKRLGKVKAVAVLLLIGLSSCAVRPPADHEYERPGPFRQGLRQEPTPSRIR